MSYTDLLFTNKHAGDNTTIQSSAKTAVKVWLTLQPQTIDGVHQTGPTKGTSIMHYATRTLDVCKICVRVSRFVKIGSD